MLRPTPADNDDAAIYARQLDMLKELGTSKYRLPPDEAEALAKDVLLASWRHAETTEWLTGAMVCAVRSHLAGAGR